MVKKLSCVSCGSLTALKRFPHTAYIHYYHQQQQGSILPKAIYGPDTFERLQEFCLYYCVEMILKSAKLIVSCVCLACLARNEN